MGHSSVRVTEVYSKPNPKRLLVDFPSLKPLIEDRKKEDDFINSEMFAYKKEDQLDN